MFSSPFLGFRFGFRVPIASIRFTDSATPKKRVEDVMPIATGLEREEIEAELQVLGFLLLYFAKIFQFSIWCYVLVSDKVGFGG